MNPEIIRKVLTQLQCAKSQLLKMYNHSTYIYVAVYVVNMIISMKAKKPKKTKE